jgi:hypothetical protein
MVVALPHIQMNLIIDFALPACLLEILQGFIKLPQVLVYQSSSFEVPNIVWVFFQGFREALHLNQGG